MLQEKNMIIQVTEGDDTTYHLELPDDVSISLQTTNPMFFMMLIFSVQGGCHGAEGWGVGALWGAP